MFSLSWQRWMASRSEKKTNRRRQLERRRAQLSLEWLEKRDLLTTAAPLLTITPTQETASPQAVAGPSGYTPSQISQAYGFNQISFANGTIKGDGSGQTIAIVSAYNDPTIANDLVAFDQQFGLPTPAFSVLNQTGGAALPEADPTGNWEAEDALDVEWAHAMAPGANIVLVEADTDNITDLLTAVRTAADLPGVSVVSMSWGDAEFLDETTYDSYFTTPPGHTPVTFVASSGDSGAPPIYPAVSPNVLAVGGTTLTLDSHGNYVSESGWSGSGGGISAYEAQPSYQKGVVTQSATQRTNPDVAYDANPDTGFAVYDSYGSGGSGAWIDMAGTSAGAPQWAALVAIADEGRALAGEFSLDGPSQTLPMIYAMPSTAFHDIVSGSSTGSPPYSAAPGYDLVTGRGTPFASRVVNYLVDGTSPPLTNSPPPSGSSPILSPSPSAPPDGNFIGDGDFESPYVGPSQALNPGGSPWFFLGWSGIAGNGSYLMSANSPPLNSTQSAFLYNQTSSILQSVSLAAGTYKLSFQAAQVGTIPGSQEQIEVFVNGVAVATVAPGPNFTTYTTTFTVPSTGTYTIQFQGLASNTSSAALIDNVFLESGTPSSPAAPPSPSPSSSPSPAPSSLPTSGQPSVSAGQAAQNNNDPMIQGVLASLYEVLLSDLLFIQTELNQYLHASGSTVSIQLVPNLDGLTQQDAIMQLVAEWQWLDKLLSNGDAQS